MNTQKMFDGVWRHFIIRRARPARRDHGGLYSGGEAKCPIGLFMPAKMLQEVKRKRLNGEDIERVMQKMPEVQKLFSGIPVTFLTKLQSIHDKAGDANDSFHGDILKGLLRLADRYDLKVPGDVA